ncbi:D-alanyl-D-alanine carboxypeptidase [Cohnella rhizosphaerae]|uniref:D-alanyl-D-alanine carboxypeptidase n=1 Tax=Cohnella rhizosphaerae TaxID=1457232 RepID=A0A9X4QUS9_9BACL|nr:D-alanyl-D-alanine carboxypeptidase family protein [Cohnella rhizosphaerae]MDG0812576.1 D-alanyl-D-alanine carboxypeptidase [Cohnella rhizosphaerae]
MLYVKNGDERLYPASIAKIATAIIALEQASLDDVATVSKTARGEEGTRVYLAEGEQVTMEKLLYGMMLNSGNDAATAIAERIDGSKEKFAERMNAFMRDTIKAYDSNFVNPSGLPDPNQYTTASDMAKLARYAMDNETFKRIVSTRKLPWSGQEWTSTLENHNKMLTDYPGATGIKNGYTIAAGNTLVGSAERDGMSLIGVVLKADSKKIAYSDMAAMLDYGFENFGVRLLFAEGERYKRQDGAVEASEWIADRAIWGVYPKRASPVMKIDENGRVFLESERGTYAAGELSPLKKGSRHFRFFRPARCRSGSGRPRCRRLNEVIRCRLCGWRLARRRRGRYVGQARLAWPGALQAALGLEGPPQTTRRAGLCQLSFQDGRLRIADRFAQRVGHIAFDFASLVHRLNLIPFHLIGPQLDLLTQLALKPFVFRIFVFARDRPNDLPVLADDVQRGFAVFLRHLRADRADGGLTRFQLRFADDALIQPGLYLLRLDNGRSQFSQTPRQQEDTHSGSP